MQNGVVRETNTLTDRLLKNVVSLLAWDKNG